MEISITFRQMEPTDALKQYVSEKLTKISKFLHQPVEAQVYLSMERYLHCAEITIHAKQFKTHAEEKSDDMYTSIDRAVETLEKTARRHKEKVKDSKTQPGTPAPTE